MVDLMVLVFLTALNQITAIPMPGGKFSHKLRGKRDTTSIGFDPDLQRISVTGAHAFVPPGPGDQRGPCPGLNALANHNYLPHSGVATLDQFIEATSAVFGMGADLSIILALFGGFASGNGYSWSIGGAPNGSLLSLLGESQGLSNSHNKYENDASPTRGDLYTYHDDANLVLSQFEDLLAQQNATNANYDLSVLTPFRSKRYDQSVSMNPYFFYGPVSGLIVSPAAYTFIYRFMANKSAEYPEGILNQEVLKSFFAVNGSNSNLTYTKGYERIPENWYRRAVGDEYTLAYFLVDLLDAAIQDPKFIAIGGNTGTVNTFTGVNLGDLTGGVYNSKTLLEGDNLVCFLFQLLEAIAADALKGVVSTVYDVVEGLLESVIGNATSGLECPELNGYYPSLFSVYPGYSKLQSDGSYPASSKLVRIRWSGLPTF